MRKTYVTRLPDKAGAFLTASRIIDAHGGRIVRANYNRALDLHTLFVEICAEPAQHEKIGEALKEHGFLAGPEEGARILMIALKLPRETGALTPALEVLNRHRINISYVNAQEEEAWQILKMGILVDSPDAGASCPAGSSGNTGEISLLLDELSQICETRILDYEVTDRLLDGTVFYVTFANEMRQILNLNQHDTNCVLIRANKLMQILDSQDKPALQTFDYIRRFAEFVTAHHGEHFDVKISDRMLAEDLKLTVLEPPCGSNTYVLEHGEELLFVDGGYGCFREEMTAILRERFPGFDRRKKAMVITHVDMDHTGLIPLAEPVYMSRDSYDDLALEAAGEKGYREQNPKHMPYFGLAEFITQYTPPELRDFRVIGDIAADGSPDRFPADAQAYCGNHPASSGEPDTAGSFASLFRFLGTLPFGGRRFDVFEGPGGHVKGEIILVCEELKLIFSGDIYVNVKGISPEQREFNRLAPFLLTGVDEDPALSRTSRVALVARYQGYLCCPGHGPVINL